MILPILLYTPIFFRLVYDIFGTLPNKNIRTGHNVLKKRFTGALDLRYYPEKMDSVARKVYPSYTTELQERRLEKLDTLRRRGKGPPKKGSGKKKR